MTRFRPARRNGRAMRSIMYMPFDFKLRGGAPFSCPITAEFRFRCRP